MDLSAVRRSTFPARLDCRYLLREPAAMDERTVLVAALHGYGQTPEIILPLMDRLFGGRQVIAAIEAPYQFFTGPAPGEAGHCWITGRHSASSIRLHHDMVLHVLNEAGREFGIPPERRILAGFSQPVGLNYRFAATWPDAVGGVIGLCGGLPGDWDSGAYLPVSAAALHIARAEDEHYPAAVTEQYAARLRLRCEDVEFHLLPGGHRFPSRGSAIVEGWLGRILR